MKRRYKMRRVVERFRDADKIERDRLECGHVVIATRAQLSTGTIIYLAPDRRRCVECAYLRRCAGCGEPEVTKGERADGGDVGWFDAADGLVCNACGHDPLTGRAKP